MRSAKNQPCLANVVKTPAPAKPMKIQPQQYYLLVSVHDKKDDNSEIVLPEGVQVQPYGHVIAVGPNCQFCTVGDLVLFLPQNMIGMEDKTFIIPESCVFAKYVS
jgi:hypothetical protein